MNATVASDTFNVEIMARACMHAGAWVNACIKFVIQETVSYILHTST